MRSRKNQHLFDNLARAAGRLPGWMLSPAAALASAMRARRARQLHRSPVPDVSRNSLLDMPWPEFAALVGGYFRRRGYQVMDTAAAESDAGLELEVGKDGGRYLVQCKRWRAERVGVDGVQDLLAALSQCAAAGGFVVTAGSFTPGAFRFTEGRNVALIDGRALLAELPARSYVGGP